MKCKGRDVWPDYCNTLISPPQVSASVSCPALLKVLAVILVTTAEYRLLRLAESFLKLKAPFEKNIAGGFSSESLKAERASENPVEAKCSSIFTAL